MDRDNIIIGALAGAVLGAIVGACLNTEKGSQLVDSATERVKDLSNRVVNYAKENMPGRKAEPQQSSYQG